MYAATTTTSTTPTKGNKKKQICTKYFTYSNKIFVLKAKREQFMFKFVIFFVYFPLLELRILGVIEIICLTYYFTLVSQIEGQKLSKNETWTQIGHTRFHWTGQRRGRARGKGGKAKNLK